MRTNKISGMIGRSPINPFLFVVGKLAFIASGFFFLITIIVPISLLYSSRATSIIGIMLLVTGFCLAGFALFHLGESVAVGLPDRQTALKTRGLYRFSRNPVYVGGILMCIGSCLYAIHVLNILLFMTALIIHHAIILKEEEYLENKFGSAWLEYKKRVPRYIGI
ncbi:isoprenylcysteine carboxylmethyltransferase family protein [bacterium]|nr:MAG: isoprenylcysteine carboxylmethyltransferase family protein [bacterium]